MNLLAIDTSTDHATVALAFGSELLSDEQGSLRQHAQFLLPMIERLLASASLSFSQLDAIVFGCGPGSFTGLRIACSVAKGLAYAHDLPMYPVSGLASIAYEAKQAHGIDSDVLAIIDARMQQVYWGCFSKSAIHTQEQVSAPSEIRVNSPKLVLAGTGYEEYLPLFPENLSQQIIKHMPIYPNASSMIRLVQNNHITPVNAADALPVYIRNQVTSGGGNG
jgi:tRNA threonylcarbamoyladenosine biosynthesis protein TsaB